MIAHRALQIGAGRIVIGQALEAVGRQPVRLRRRDRDVPFADIGRLVAGLLQQLAVGRVGAVQHRRDREIGERRRLDGLGQPALLRIEARDQHAPRRRAGDGGGMMPAELHPALPQAEQVRHEFLQKLPCRLHPGGEHARKAHLIDHDEKDIGRRGVGRGIASWFLRHGEPPFPPHNEPRSCAPGCPRDGNRTTTLRTDAMP